MHGHRSADNTTDLTRRRVKPKGLLAVRVGGSKSCQTATNDEFQSLHGHLPPVNKISKPGFADGVTFRAETAQLKGSGKRVAPANR